MMYSNTNLGAYPYWQSTDNNNPSSLIYTSINDLVFNNKEIAKTSNNGSIGKLPPQSHLFSIKPDLNDEEKQETPATAAPSTEDHLGKLRPYSCTDCGKSFLQKHHLTTHAKVHSGIKAHVCKECGKSFTHKHCLNTHMLLHSSERPHQCYVCKKSFTLKHHLLSHSKVHTREKPYVCKECGLSFPLKRHLVTHGKFHAGERPFICEECGESFAQKHHLVMHKRFHGFINSFACTDCNATFTRKFELVNHSKLHGNFPLKCSFCGKEFIQERTFLAHMRYHNEEPTVDKRKNKSSIFTCTQCNISFNNNESLALHIKLHSGNPSLISDLYTLTKKTNLFAKEMNFGESNSAAAVAVAATAAKRIKIKSYYCKFCLKAFTAKHGLQQHNGRHPEGTCAIRTHICATCNRGFFQKNHLMLHQRQHASNPIANAKPLTSDDNR